MSQRSGWIAIGVGMVALASAGMAAETKPAELTPATAVGIVAGRQAAFLLSGADFGAMKGAIDRGDDVKTQAFAARALTRWARALPGMFPAGSALPTSKALPSVWSDRAGFEAKAADYAAAAQKLSELAAANDKAGFAAQWAETRKTCSACHDVYRQPDEKPKG